MVHVHIRDDDARPTLDQGRLKDTVAALREPTGLVVQLSHRRVACTTRSRTGWPCSTPSRTPAR